MENIKQKTQEILVENGLDFRIEKEPLLGTSGRPTDFFGLYNSKSNKCLNVVKDGYTISQNDEIVELVLSGMEKFGDSISVQKAGSLNDGRKVYIQLKLQGASNVNGDIIERFVTIIDSNDGSTSLSVGTGDKTMSCQNQFYRFYKNSQSKFRHTATIEQKKMEIPYLIQSALNESLQQVELYRKMESTPLTKNLSDKLVQYLLGYDRVLTSAEKLASISNKSVNHMERLYTNIEHQISEKGENFWGLHSGVTRWTTHDLSSPKRDNGKVESMLTGTAYKYNNLSMEFLAELVY